MPSQSRSRSRSPRERASLPARLRCPSPRQRINPSRRNVIRRRRAPNLCTPRHHSSACHQPHCILRSEPPRPHKQQRRPLKVLARQGRPTVRHVVRRLGAVAASPSVIVGCVSSTHAPRRRMPRRRIRLGTLHLGGNRSVSSAKARRTAAAAWPTAATKGAGAHVAAMRTAAFVKGRPRGLRCTPPLLMTAGECLLRHRHSPHLQGRLALPSRRMAW